MLGAIIGDIVGSRFEFNNNRSEEFDFFCDKCYFTDDSVLTFATFDAIQRNISFAESYKKWFRLYPNKGYGGRFRTWGMSDDMQPYNSWGNGSAMRVSPCGWAADDLETVLSLATGSASATHNHPEGIKGAVATSHAIFLARKKESKNTIRETIEKTYGYSLDFYLNDLIENYRFHESCQETVPQAIYTFLISDSFEDSIRKGISIGGDSDTIGAINGGIAEAFYGVPPAMRKKALSYLDERMVLLIKEFERKYGT